MTKLCVTSEDFPMTRTDKKRFIQCLPKREGIFFCQDEFFSKNNFWVEKFINIGYNIIAERREATVGGPKIYNCGEYNKPSHKSGNDPGAACGASQLFG